MRSLSYTAEICDGNLRLELILKRKLGLTEKQIRQLKFLNDGITVNGMKSRTNREIQAGDMIRVTFSDVNRRQSHVVPDHKPLRILYEDEDLIAIDKDAGEICHPSHGHYNDTLANHISALLSSRGEQNPLPRCIGRLDKDTSGILVFAKNPLAAQRLILQREKGLFYKEYLALVNGSFPKEHLSGVISVPIAHLPGSLMKMYPSPDGKKAETHYQVLCSDSVCSLIRCRIFTGRTHQIRVHMASVGYPLIGDPLYGQDRAVTSSRTALHAWKLHFHQPVTGEQLVLESFRTNMFC